MSIYHYLNMQPWNLVWEDEFIVFRQLIRYTCVPLILTIMMSYTVHHKNYLKENFIRWLMEMMRHTHTWCNNGFHTNIFHCNKGNLQATQWIVGMYNNTKKIDVVKSMRWWLEALSAVHLQNYYTFKKPTKFLFEHFDSDEYCHSCW